MENFSSKHPTYTIHFKSPKNSLQKQEITFDNRVMPNKENYVDTFKNRMASANRPENEKPSTTLRPASYDKKPQPTSAYTNKPLSGPLSPASLNTANIDPSLVFNSPRFTQQAVKESSIDKYALMKGQNISKSTRNSSKNEDLEKSNFVYNKSSQEQSKARNLTKSDNEFCSGTLSNEKYRQIIPNNQKQYNNFMDDKKNDQEMKFYNDIKLSTQQSPPSKNNSESYRNNSATKKNPTSSSFDFTAIKSSQQQQQQEDKSKDSNVKSNALNTTKKLLENIRLASLELDDLQASIGKKIANHYNTLQERSPKYSEVKKATFSLVDERSSKSHSREPERTSTNKASKSDEKNFGNHYSYKTQSQIQDDKSSSTQKKESSIYVNRSESSKGRTTAEYSINQVVAEKYKNERSSASLNKNSLVKSKELEADDSLKRNEQRSPVSKQYNMHSTDYGTFKRNQQTESPKLAARNYEQSRDIAYNNFVDDEKKGFFTTAPNNINSKMKSSGIDAKSNVLKSANFERLNSETTKDYYINSKKMKENKDKEREMEKYTEKDREKTVKLVEQYQKMIGKMSKTDDIKPSSRDLSLSNTCQSTKDSRPHSSSAVRQSFENQIVSKSYGMNTSSDDYKNTLSSPKGLKDFVTQVPQGNFSFRKNIRLNLIRFNSFVQE